MAISPRWEMFQIYLFGIPRSPIVTYADDYTIMSSGPIADGICVKLNTYFAELAAYFHARNRKISLTKTHSLSHDLRIWKTAEWTNLGGTLIPTTNYPKLLGVAIDTMLQATVICNTMKIQNKVLRR